MKKVTVVTIDTRKFVQDVLALGAVGGELTEGCVAVKGMFLRAEVMVPKGAIVETSDRVSVSAGYIAEQTVQKEEVAVEKEFVVEDKNYSREELEGFSIKQVKEITGLSGRDKIKMIEDYLSNKAVE